MQVGGTIKQIFFVKMIKKNEENMTQKRYAGWWHNNATFLLTEI